MTDSTYLEVAHWLGAPKICNDQVQEICASIDDYFPGTQIIAPSLWKHPELIQEQEDLNLSITDYACSHLIPTADRVVFSFNQHGDLYEPMFSRITRAILEGKPVFGIDQ